MYMKDPRIIHNLNINTPVGILRLQFCHDGLHGLSFEDDSGSGINNSRSSTQENDPLNYKLSIDRLEVNFAGSEYTAATELMEGKLGSDYQTVLRWLHRYFVEICAEITLPVDEQSKICDDTTIPRLCAFNNPKCLGVSSFAHSVYKEMVERVHCGQRLTYGELADAVGVPKAARAVGSAMRRNPVVLVIPCHRVVASTGIGKYCGGRRNQVKRMLLDQEALWLARLKLADNYSYDQN